MRNFALHNYKRYLWNLLKMIKKLLRLKASFNDFTAALLEVFFSPLEKSLQFVAL